MYVGRSFSPSNPGESEPYTFDFKRDLPAGETVATAIWSCAAVEGTDAQAADRLVGSPVNSGSKTTHRVADLQAGVTYRLQADATSSPGGHDVTLWSHVECEAPS